MNNLIRYVYELRLEIPHHMRTYVIYKWEGKNEKDYWTVNSSDDCFYFNKNGEWVRDSKKKTKFKSLQECLNSIKKYKLPTVEDAITEFESFIAREDEEDQKGLREVLAFFQAEQYKSAAARAGKLDTFVREGIPAIVWYYMDKENA